MTEDTAVRLREWKAEDRRELALLANNIRIWNNVRDRLPYPYTLQHADEFILYCRRLQPPSVLAVEVEGSLAGCIGIELQSDIYRYNAEIGYWIGEPFWGRGIATEAVRQFMPYLRTTFPDLVRVYASVFAYNTPSMRVLEKNGFELEGIRRRAVFKNGELHDDHIYVRFNED